MCISIVNFDCQSCALLEIAQEFPNPMKDDYSLDFTRERLNIIFLDSVSETNHSNAVKSAYCDDSMIRVFGYIEP